MKKFIAIILLLPMLLSSCKGRSETERRIKSSIEGAHIDRVIITSTRNAAKYTIVDLKSISRIKGNILKAKDANKDTKLEPDFIFKFFEGRKEAASFEYIAGINDKDEGNLIDDKGSLYNISSIIEDEFLKRIMRKTSSKNVPEYYISLIELILEKTNAQHGSTVVVDVIKDYTVTKSILSVEQKRILDSVDKKGIKIILPSEKDGYDYYIKINTSSYTDIASKGTVSVKNKLNVETIYHVEGNFKDGKWSYYIRFK